MTSLDSVPLASASRPGRLPAPRIRDRSGPSAGRWVGVDLARALAVLGMFAVHVGPLEAERSDVGGWLHNLSEGRASALFATLAGLSLVLIAGMALGRLDLATSAAGSGSASIAGAFEAEARLPWLRQVAGPVIAVGTMSLTIYVAPVLAIIALPGRGVTPPDTDSTFLLCTFVLGAVAFAGLWSRFSRRGPLEYLLNSATKGANFVR